jgi:hypothetical protein
MDGRPNSSNDLVLEQMREVIGERQRDLSDGISPRSLSKRIDEHSNWDRQQFGELEKRIRELEEHKAASEARVEMDTSRFRLPPVAINMGDRSTKRPSIAPLVKAVTKNPAFTWAVTAIIVVLGQLLSRCGVVLPPH